ncbi:MAG: hypothetical protein U0704_12090 [Candidatus Eisenbacteria bacterium]
MRHRAPGPLLTALALLCAGAVVHPAVAAGPTSLAEATAAWRAWVSAYRPDLAAREGLPYPRHPEPLGAEGFVHATRALARARDAIAAVDRAPLPPGDAARLDTLAARADREWSAHAREAWRNDPEFWAALTLEPALAVAAGPARVSPCERSRRAIARLRAVPEALRSAQVLLRDARAFDRERALARWDEAIRRARTELPAVFLACKEAGRLADAVEADSSAIAAAERFRVFVREDLVQSARPR